MNCIVICCDTFRADMIGHPTVRTPSLDGLAEGGVVFKNAFAEGMPTIQARRTMFTGIRSFPWRLGLESRGLSPFIPGVVREFAEHLQRELGPMHYRINTNVDKRQAPPNVTRIRST